MRILMYLCLPAILLSCNPAKEKKETMPMPVKVVQVEAATGGSQREFTFIAKPSRITELSFRVSGPVVDFDIRPGQFYPKGQVIAAIDSRDFRVRKEKAEAVHAQAEAEYKRIATLYKKNNISGSSYEKARAELAIAKAAFETAANEFADTQLKAPFDGYVQTVHIERFQDVRASQPVVTFIDLAQLKAEAYIPENIAIGLGKGTDVLTLRFDAIADKEYTATEVDISKSTTSNNISFLLTALLENPGKELLGGMSGVLSFALPSETAGAAVLIPQAAVCHRPVTGAYVWKLDPPTGRVRAVRVTPGNLRANNRIEILAGLAIGETVALTGHAFLADGQVITVQK